MLKKLVSLPVLLTLFALAAPAAHAQKYYINLTATYKSTNDGGAFLTSRMSSATLLNEIFPDATVARGHSLIFDLETGEVQVIHKTSGEVIGTWYQFNIDTELINGQQTKGEFYWTVSCPVDEGFAGTAVGTIQLTRGTENEITRFKMTGKLTLRYQPSGSGSPRVYSGVFATGLRYIAPLAPASR